MLRYHGNTEPIDLSALDAYENDETARAKSARRHSERIHEHRDRNDGVSKRGSWFGLIICGAGVVAAFFIYLHGDIMLHEINKDMVAADMNISELQRDNDRLITELESIATPSRVEEFATERGLVKEQVLNVTHVAVSVDHTVEVAIEEEPTFWEQVGELFDEWKSFFE
ncbi:MAG: hypothetical protein FWG45_02995 [Oscillospiraceae bacterium]|nr:hypothetical protein [Oscillospiraceae bacterium]